MENPTVFDTSTEVETIVKKSSQNRRILFIALGVIALAAIIIGSLAVHRKSVDNRAERAAKDIIEEKLADYQSEMELFASVDRLVYEGSPYFSRRTNHYGMQRINGIYYIYYNYSTAYFYAFEYGTGFMYELYRDFDATVTYDPKTDTAICTSLKWTSDWRDTN